jgi:hypothetical protein
MDKEVSFHGVFLPGMPFPLKAISIALCGGGLIFEGFRAL